MRKMRRSKRHRLSKDRSAALSLPNDLRKEELIEIMALAIIRSEEIKARKEEKENNRVCRKLRQAMRIGQKEKIGIIHCLGFQFVDKKAIKGVRGTFIALKSIMAAILFGISWLLFSISCLCFIDVVLKLVKLYLFPVNVIDTISTTLIKTIPIFSIALVAAPIFRMIAIEVENMKDRNLILGVFSAFAAFASIIVTILVS